MLGFVCWGSWFVMAGDNKKDREKIWNPTIQIPVHWKK